MLQEIQLHEIAVSPTNPRKTFDDEKLQELARSIGEVGVLEPILVRPHYNGNGVRFEVIAGERRFRAAAICRIDTVPCIVRDLDDVQVLEIQTIENLQRDNLHPLEEADGFARLMKDAGYDVTRIAARISKSEKYVYDRIKLLQLIPELQKVFLEGEITAGHAILLARLSSADQQRCLGDDEDGFNQMDGLFRPEKATDVELELDDERVPRKPASVRELQHWINEHVRFRPEEADPFLFPETMAAVRKAEEQEIKIVKITREHYVQPEARDSEERTIGPHSWKRADGKVEHSDFVANGRPSKTCDHSVLGVVVAGPGRSESFQVCVAKKKCAVHWKEEQEAANERGAPNGAGTKSRPAAAAPDTWRQKQEEERKRHEAEMARWKKGAPKILEALAAKLKTTPAIELVDLVLKELVPYGHKAKQMDRGKTIEDAIRYGAFLILSETVQNEWSGPREAPKQLKPWGIDTKKILDEAAPKPKAEKKPAPAKAKPAPKAKKAKAGARG